MAQYHQLPLAHESRARSLATPSRPPSSFSFSSKLAGRRLFSHKTLVLLSTFGAALVLWSYFHGSIPHSRPSRRPDVMNNDSPNFELEDHIAAPFDSSRDKWSKNLTMFDTPMDRFRGACGSIFLRAHHNRATWLTEPFYVFREPVV